MPQDTEPNGATALEEYEYEVRFVPSEKRVRVEYNGTWVADSTNAVIVHETRATPMYYFPKDDVRMDFLEKTDHQTHCPFKGNASYWSLKVGGGVAENAVWGYEDPDADSETIRGMLSFYPNMVSAIYEGDEEVAFLDGNVESMHANSLAGWLLSEAWKLESSDQLMAGFCKFLHEGGFPVDRMTIIIPTLHPQVFATVLVWRADEPEVKIILESHDILHQPKFADSPFAPIIRGGPAASAGASRATTSSWTSRWSGNSKRKARPTTPPMPFRFSDGQINVLSMTSFAEGGFTTAHFGQVYEVLPVLGRPVRGARPAPDVHRPVGNLSRPAHGKARSWTALSNTATASASTPSFGSATSATQPGIRNRWSRMSICRN